MLVSKSVTGTGGERWAQVPVAASGRALQVIAAGTIPAIIIALIPEPFVSLPGRLRLPRAVATFGVCVGAPLQLYRAGLAAWNQVSTFASDVPALLLAALTGTFFAITRLPCSFLTGVLRGLLSLVPCAGIALALPPPLLAASGVTVFAINVMYRTLAGARVHLNPLIVTFWLMFGGFLWDAPALLPGIPLTAGLEAVCDDVAVLRKYGRFLGD